MDVTTRREAGTPVVTAAGRLTGFEQADTLRIAVDKALDGDNDGLIVDFGPLTYISSAGLRAVAMAVNAARKARVRIVFIISTPTVLDVFSVSGFDQLVEIAESFDAANAALAA